MLATGTLMSMSGTTLAVTGMSGSGSAGVAMYDAPKPRDNSTVPPGDQGTTTPDQGTVLGGPGSDDPQADTQAGVTRGAASLPFTGFLAIPLLVGGVALLSAGLVLRRRASHGKGRIAP